MDSEITYKVALSMTLGVDATVVRMMKDVGMSLGDFFTLDMFALASGWMALPYFRILTVSNRCPSTERD